MCFPPLTSIAPVERTVSGWQRPQSVLGGCGNGGGAPWHEPHAVVPADTAVHVGVGVRAARAERGAVAVGRCARGAVPHGSRPLGREPRERQRDRPVHVREIRDRRVAGAARERAPDRSGDDVLLVRTDRALRRQRLAVRAGRRGRVHALGAVAGRATTAVHLHGAVDVLPAGEIDRAAREHGARVAARALGALRVREGRRRAVARAAGRLGRAARPVGRGVRRRR